MLTLRLVAQYERIIKVHQITFFDKYHVSNITMEAILETIIADKKMIAYCGLYCGACKMHLKGKCNGCHKNEKATWCKVRACCLANKYSSCASCKEYSNTMECGKFNNFMSKFFGFVFKSDRAACISKIKENGLDEFVDYMARNGLSTIKKVNK
jgi:hypothetical protein